MRAVEQRDQRVIRGYVALAELAVDHRALGRERGVEHAVHPLRRHLRRVVQLHVRVLCAKHIVQHLGPGEALARRLIRLERLGQRVLQRSAECHGLREARQKRAHGLDGLLRQLRLRRSRMACHRCALCWQVGLGAQSSGHVANCTFRAASTRA